MLNSNMIANFSLQFLNHCLKLFISLTNLFLISMFILFLSLKQIHNKVFEVFKNFQGI